MSRDPCNRACGVPVSPAKDLRTGARLCSYSNRGDGDGSATAGALDLERSSVVARSGPRGWRLAALMSEAVLNRLDLELRLKSCVVNVCLERYVYSMDFVLMCSYDTVVHDVPLLPCY